MLYSASKSSCSPVCYSFLSKSDMLYYGYKSLGGIERYSFLSKSDMLYSSIGQNEDRQCYSFLSKSDMLYYQRSKEDIMTSYSFLSKSDMLYYILNNLLISQQVIPFSKYKTKAIKAAYHLFLPLFLRFQLKFPSRYIVFLLSLTFQRFLPLESRILAALHVYPHHLDLYKFANKQIIATLYIRLSQGNS